MKPSEEQDAFSVERGILPNEAQPQITPGIAGEILMGRRMAGRPTQRGLVFDARINLRLNKGCNIPDDCSQE